MADTPEKPCPSRRFGRHAYKYAYRKNGEMQNDVTRTEMVNILQTALKQDGLIEIKYANNFIELEKVS